MTTEQELSKQHQRVRRIRDEIQMLTEEYVLELEKERRMLAEFQQEREELAEGESK